MITIENLPALLEFGGAAVYEVQRFDPIDWRSEPVLRTFNHARANALVDKLTSEGETVRLVSYLVRFDVEEVA